MATIEAVWVPRRVPQYPAISSSALSLAIPSPSNTQSQQYPGPSNTQPSLAVPCPSNTQPPSLDSLEESSEGGWVLLGQGTARDGWVLRGTALVQPSKRYYVALTEQL